MGLAAGQARLLSITARKSDCEYQSMSLSHQKLAISRDLAAISSEYQNSLDQTKLMYDFYGNGSSEQLKYSTLMTPSALNNYLPITITNTSGRTVLNSKFAEAARAAGIPQEGLGCTPSSIVREKFILGLGDAGVIDKDKAKAYAATQYNQTSGLGGDSTGKDYTVVEGTLDDLKAVLGMGDDGASVAVPVLSQNHGGNNGSGVASISGTEYSGSILITKLLSNDPNDQYIFYGISENGRHFTNNQAMDMADTLTATGGFIDQLYNSFASALTTGDPRSTAALNYAKEQVIKEFFTYSYGNDTRNGQIGDSQEGSSNDNGCWNFVVNNGSRPKHQQEEAARENILSTATNFVGITGNSYWKGGRKGGRYNAACAVNLNNIAKAFLSYFAKFMSGLPTDGSQGEYYSNKGYVADSNFVTNDNTYVYYFPGADNSSEEDGKNSLFYDTLLNQICTSGWTENSQIDDPEYLQQMLQNGMMFISKIKDDGFYYQGNYATDSYIKEVTDETAVAQAEAKYNTEKTKLNNKEQTLDLKMKNLDTEISALTTEYDTVKNTISKNIEKSFKRYNA